MSFQTQQQVVPILPLLQPLPRWRDLLPASFPPPRNDKAHTRWAENKKARVGETLAMMEKS
ncbi:hypothetical protein ATO50_09385 [Aeromonas hydrophila]|nr:hypothetical protein ATO50_09385 [Aeromonas hydrophila]